MRSWKLGLKRYRPIFVLVGAFLVLGANGILFTDNKISFEFRKNVQIKLAMKYPRKISKEEVEQIKNDIKKSVIGRACGGEWIDEQLKDFDSYYGVFNGYGGGFYDEEYDYVQVDSTKFNQEQRKSVIAHEWGHKFFNSSELREKNQWQMVALRMQIDVYGEEVFNTLDNNNMNKQLSYFGGEVENVVGAEFFWKSLKNDKDFSEIIKSFDEIRGNGSFDKGFWDAYGKGLELDSKERPNYSSNFGFGLR